MESLGYGVATSAYQIEGAVEFDGRGPSIWDTFCALPGAIADGSDGSVACASYLRVEDDLELIRQLGVTAYRFSVAWPRVQPTGSGRVESRGLDYYERLVDGLLAAGVRPFPTLYHWDLPQALEDDGGWPVRQTAERFAEYAGLVADRLADRVVHWSTMNEPWCSAFLGYAAGVHAPGRRDPEAAYAAAHHLLLGHALGRAAVRAVNPSADVGIVLNLAPVWPERDAPAAVGDLVDAIQNRLWLDALAEGAYPRVLTASSPSLSSQGVVRDDDLALVRGSADWLGINYYTPLRPASGSEDTGAVAQTSRAYPYAPLFRFRPHEPLTDMGWEVDAAGMHAILLRAAERLPGVPLRITENGAAFADTAVTSDGSVEDADRIGYLHGHLAAVATARAAGADVRDYFAWSLLDNFEWAEGCRRRFGLVRVDPLTQDRVPKASFHWYAQRCAGD
jgi:beta-glucosidase